MWDDISFVHLIAFHWWLVVLNVFLYTHWSFVYVLWEISIKFLSIQFSLITQSCSALCYPMDCSTPGFPIHHQLPRACSNSYHQVGDAIQPSHLLSSPSPPAFNLPQHQDLFQWVSSSHQVARILEFQLQHQSSNDYSGPISFRIDWFDLAVQETFRSLLQHHSSKASVL